MKQWLKWTTLLVIAGVAGMAIWLTQRGNGPIEPGQPVADKAAQIAQGRYLAQAADCMACHTARGSAPYAGGRAIKTAYGTFITPNLTPDRATGLGSWSADDFWRALHLGRSRDGHPLYPAFPYTDYTQITRADADAIFAYLHSLPATNAPTRPHDLRFPYSQRSLMYAWQALYFAPGSYQAEAGKDAVWNRGAYLVNGIGHCGACHTSRNALGSKLNKSALAGGFLAVQDWYAPALEPGATTSEHETNVDELAGLLRTGVSAHHAVYGPMSEVVFDSLQYLNEDDAHAVASYLHSLTRAEPPPPPENLTRLSKQDVDAMMRRGAQLYGNDCVACHQANGAGVHGIYPELGGNASVLAPSPVNPIRMVLNGGFPPATMGNPRPYGMPPFGPSYSDNDVAAVVTYLRQSWGNDASAVAPQDVARFRSTPIN